MPYKIKIFRDYDRKKIEAEANDFLSTNRFVIEQPVFLYSTCTAEQSNGAGGYTVHVVNSLCIVYLDTSPPDKLPVTLWDDGDIKSK